MSDDKNAGSGSDVIQLDGSNSPSGSIRVTLDLELPHAEAMTILDVVHAYKEKQRKVAEAAERRRLAEERKAAAAAKKATRSEAQQAKKSGGASKSAG